MNALRMLIKSPAFWTALFSAVGLIALKYLHVPEDVWNVILGLLGTVVAILTADGAVKAFARGLVEGNREMLIDLRRQEKERMLSLEDKG